MANKRDLKKDINYVFGSIIEMVYAWQISNSGKDVAAGEAIIDEAIEAFDGFISRVNVRDYDNAATHFKGINQDLENVATALIEKVNAL
ncbi:hypothetical protein [Aquimarina rhabdastrellae]